MIEPVISLYLADEAAVQIPDNYVKSFKLYASIFSSFPGAEIILNDPEGKFLANLAIKPGNAITMLSAPGGAIESPTILPLTPLRILGIHNPGVYTTEDPSALGSLGGDFRIQATHPWAIQTDWTNHAYRKRSSDIVRDVIAAGDQTRGFTFSNINIKDSDDKGNITRYKISESEARFIHQKILPYTTIDNQAVYSFVDELGAFHFRSFVEMYSQAPKLIVIPPLSDAIPTGLFDQESKVAQLGIYDGAWWIGRKFLEQLGNFKKIVYAENTHPDISKSFVARIPYKSSIPGFTLMKKELIDNLTTGTDSAIFPFRDFEDIARLNTNNNAIMNEYFEISATVDFAADLATVGTTIEMRLAGDNPTKEHWLNGKWLVVASEHSQHEDMRYYSKYRLARPAISSLPDGIDSASLYNASMR